MRWLWFVASLLCFVVVFRTQSLGLGFLGLVLSFVFMIVGTLAVASSRISSRSRDAGSMLGPEELRKMRENIARKKAAGSGAESGHADAGIVGVSTMTAMMASGHESHADAADASDAGGDGGGD